MNCLEGLGLLLAESKKEIKWPLGRSFSDLQLRDSLERTRRSIERSMLYPVTGNKHEIN